MHVGFVDRAMDERMVGAAEWRILADLVVTFDGQTERSLIRGLALKANVAKEALRRLKEGRCVHPTDSEERPSTSSPRKEGGI